MRGFTHEGLGLSLVARMQRRSSSYVGTPEGVLPLIEKG